MHTFLADLRYGARLLSRSPGYTVVSIAALAIGIGANLTIFGFAKELLLSAPRGIADAGSRRSRVQQSLFRDFTAELRGVSRPQPQLRRPGGVSRRIGQPSDRRVARAAVCPRCERELLSRPGSFRGHRADDRAVRRSAGRSRRRRPERSMLASALRPKSRRARTDADDQRPLGDDRRRRQPEFTGTMAPLVPDFFMPLAQSSRGGDGSVQIIGRLRPA